MNSLTLKLEDEKAVTKTISEIKKSGTSLELAPMNFGRAGQSNPFDRLFVAGNSKEIEDKLELAIGKDWKKHVIQGEIIDGKKDE